MAEFLPDLPRRGAMTVKMVWQPLVRPPPVPSAVKAAVQGARCRRECPRDRPQGIVFGPIPQGSVHLRHGLAGVAGEHRAATTLHHEVPHGGVGELGAPMIGRPAFVGNKVKTTTLNRQVALLGPESGHCGPPGTGRARPEMADPLRQQRGGKMSNNTVRALETLTERFLEGWRDGGESISPFLLAGESVELSILAQAILGEEQIGPDLVPMGQDLVLRTS
jgi:hypothetical protein